MAKDGPPALLGDFLNFLVRRRRGLHIHVLNWDYPMVFGTDREFPPIYGFGWTPPRRVHLRYDDTHPIAGSPAPEDRGDRRRGRLLRRHRPHAAALGLPASTAPDDPRRVADDKPYPPFHDLMVAVDGDAARALGEHRARALAARHRRAAQAGRSADDGSLARRSSSRDMRDVDVGIARTMPPRGEAPAVREVEKLYLDMIAAARAHIYIENQYFTSPRIAAALEKRLAEPDGPEIVLVLRLLSHGWLEEHTMHVLRTRLVQQAAAPPTATAASASTTRTCPGWPRAAASTCIPS